MGFFSKLKQKIADGWLKELAAQARWMVPFFRRFWATVLVHILLGVAGILMGLLGSVASKHLIDAVVGHDSGNIGLAAGFMVGMMLGSIILKAVSSRVSAVLNIRVHNDIQAEVYRKILFADWQSLEEFRSGDLLNRLSSDVGTLSSGVVSFLPSLLSGMVQFVGAFAIMLYYDPAMAVIALLGVPVSVICSRMIARRMWNHNHELKEASSDVMSFHQDSFQNITSIKAFGITEQFVGRMTHMQEKYRDAYLNYNRFSISASTFLALVGMLVSVSCFGWGVYRLWAGVITYGTMTLFLQLASTLSASFSALIGMIPSFISLSTSTGRIMAVTELPAEDPVQSEAFRKETEFSIDLRNMSFSYHDGNSLLSDVNIYVAPGDLVALTGPSGEGKTTVLRILLGLVNAEKGEARLIGSSGRFYPLSASTRNAFSYVPQGSSLFAGTIRENLTMVAPEASDDDIWEALHAACADSFVRELPDGLDHMLGGRETGLSEGQGQRIAVARALLRGAPILLLDEATSALDEFTEGRMLRRIMRSGRVNTCILVTHRPGALKYCTKGYCVQNGQIREDR